MVMALGWAGSKVALLTLCDVVPAPPDHYAQRVGLLRTHSPEHERPNGFEFKIPCQNRVRKVRLSWDLVPADHDGGAHMQRVRDIVPAAQIPEVTKVVNAQLFAIRTLVDRHTQDQGLVDVTLQRRLMLDVQKISAYLDPESRTRIGLVVHID